MRYVPNPIAATFLRRLTSLAAPAAAALLLNSPLYAAATFQESGGRAVIEAEHFDNRTTATDNNHAYAVAPDELSAADLGTPAGQYKNARGGRYVVVMPDGGENRNSADLQNVGPTITYKVQITTLGEYQLFVRGMGWDGASDSFYVSIPELQKSAGGPGPDWYRLAPNPDTGDFNTLQNIPSDATTTLGWTGNGNPEVNNGGDGGDDAPVVWNVTKAGTYTIRFQQREDGNAIDALILQRSNMAMPTNSPAESALVQGFVIGTHPANQATTVGQAATFTVSALVPAGTAVTYQWQSKGPGAASFANIAGATSASYTTPNATDAMNGTQYRAVVTSAGVSLTSGAGTLVTDSTPPTLRSVNGGAAQTSVTLVFSEKLDKTAAQTIANYTIAGLTVTNATLDASGTTVTLRTAKQTSGTVYTVTAAGIKDAAGNAAGSLTGSFVAATPVPGKVLVRFFRNINGTAVANLTSSSTYPNSADDVVLWDALSSGDGTGDTFGENYGAEVTGFVTPPTTGTYKFYLRSDDASEFWLSTDETEAGLTRIAQQTGCCNAFTDTPGTLSSQPIQLTAGKPYFFRALLKEGGGGDFLQVGWLGPNDADINDASAVVPIDATAISTAFPKTATLTITQQPANVSVAANNAATFNVGFNAYSVFGTNAMVQWQRAPVGSTAFTDITEGTNATYTIRFPSAADNNTQYRAVLKLVSSDPAIGSLGTVTSTAASLTVGADTVAPQIKTVTASPDFTTLTVQFTEPITAATAGDKANYSLSGGVTVSSVEVVDPTTVRLTTSKQAIGTQYTLTSTGLKDLAGLSIAAPNNTSQFFTFFLSRGVVLQRFFSAVSGGLQGLRDDPRFPNNPTFSTSEPRFEYPPNGGGEGGENYGNMMSGWIVPPVTGNYVFFTCSDDPSDLFLSTDDDPANKKLIAQENAWSNPRQWTASGGGSDLANKRSDQFGSSEWPTPNVISLTAGKMYYIEVQHTEGGGGDNVGVAWMKPGDPEPANGSLPIDGSFIANYLPGATITITQQPQNITVVQNLTGTLSVGASSTGAISYQWQKAAPGGAFADIAGATSSTYTVAPSALTETGTRYRVVVSGPGSTQNSTEAILTVAPDVTAPVVTTAVRSYDNPNQVVVRFSEPVGASAGTAANYKINGTAATGATLGADKRTVTLTSATAVPNNATLGVTTVADLAGNPITAVTSFPIGLQKAVYFVTADTGTPTFPGDQAVLQHLIDRGFAVIVTAGADVPDDGSTAVGKDLIIESSSLGSGTAEVADPNGGPAIGKFKNLAIPAIEWEASSVDAFGFQEANATVGTIDNQTQINIVDPTSPLAAGFPAGPVTVTSAPATYSQSTPTNAHVVATQVADPSNKNIYYYEKGDKGFNNFVMPARRVFFFFQDNTAASANENGWKLFDAAVDWALGIESTGGGQPKLSITGSGASLSISWTDGGTLQSTSSLSPPVTWTDLPGTSPQSVSTTGNARFFRVKK